MIMEIIMHKKLLIGLFASLALMLSFPGPGAVFASGEDGKNKSEEVKSDEHEEGESKGEDIFEENCGECHGYDGVPILPEAPNFHDGERMDKSDDKLINSIAKGMGDIMPPWEEDLSKEQIAAVLAFIRTKISEGRVKPAPSE